MPRVLIITYYWPPSGGSAVLRWLKFTKYLGYFGWTPVVYTPSNPEPQEIDASLIREIPEDIQVIKKNIREPYTLYKLFTGKKKDELLGVALMNSTKSSKLRNRLSLWIRSNVFIPDPRIFWIRPSVRFLTPFIRENKIDIVITSGPPHSMHLIGLKLKRAIHCKWIADFRDPWTNIDFYRDLALTRWADRCHRRLEKQVLEEANAVITVSSEMTKEFTSMGAGKVVTITNGFDFHPVLNSNHPVKFTILHLGSLPKSRNPVNLWKALTDLVRHNPDFAHELEIKLIGKIDQTVLDTLTENQLDDYVQSIPYVPHENTPALTTSSAVLLLCINNTPNAKGILTNKFFEYLSALRPIIAIGPEDGDAAAILNETHAGKIFDYSKTSDIKEYLSDLFHLYSHKKLFINSSGIEKYSRKNLAGELSGILNSLID